MLQNIRDGARGWLAWVIVGIISVPFAFWGINEYFSPSPKTIIAEVNGVELLDNDFRQQVSQRKQQLRTMFQNQNIDLSFMEAQIRQDTLKQMVDEEVLVQSIQDAGMRIGNASLEARIHSISAFQEDGKFSKKIYEQTLRYQAGLSTTYFEYTMRREMLTNQLREGVLRSSFLTDYDQQQRTRLEKQQRFISYLIVPASRFNDSVTISDVEIEAYYKEHATQYKTAEKVSIEYVELSQADLISTENVDDETLKALYQERKASFTTPKQWKARHILIKVGKADELDVAKKKAQEVLIKIRAGDSFDDLAQEFSDDTGSKKNGGNLDWFGPGSMVKPFEDAVKGMKVGEVSEPVKSKFGFHIIELLDFKSEVIRPYAEVRKQLEEEVQSEHVQAVFEGQFEQFGNLAFENPNSLEVLTETLNLKSKSTGLFDKTGGYQKDQHPILSNSQVVEAAFGDDVLKEGYNSEPIQIEEQHVLVLRLKDHEAAKAKPLDEVKEDIVAMIKREKTLIEAQSLAQTLFDKIKQDGDANVKSYDLSWSQAQWIEREDSTLKQPAIAREVFKMGRPSENKAIYQEIQLDNGDYALVALLDVKDGVVSPKTVLSAEENKTGEDEEAQSKKIKEQQQALGSSEFNHLLSGLKMDAEIKMYLKSPSENNDE